MQITNQRRMAASILSRREGRIVGVHRIWIHPDYIDQVSSAVQKDDIRELIDEGVIKARPIQGTSRARARKAKIQRGLNCQVLDEIVLDDAVKGRVIETEIFLQSVERLIPEPRLIWVRLLAGVDGNLVHSGTFEYAPLVVADIVTFHRQRGLCAEHGGAAMEAEGQGNSHIR